LSLHRKAATHDNEIRRLYEEMEQQIINEKDQAILKVTVACAFTLYSVKNIKKREINTLIKAKHGCIK